jgi:putative flippase GtrA
LPRFFKRDKLENMKLSELVTQDTNNLLIQLIRYVVVGGVAFLVDWGLLYILTEFVGLHYLLSATLSFLAGLVVNYVLSTYWIFRHSKLSNQWAEFIIYSIIGVIGLGLNNLFLFLLTDKVGLHYMVSKIIVAAVVMLWNFFARKFILFKNKAS